MATKFTYDTTNKLFVLNAGVTSLDARTEFYSWVKHDWLTNGTLNKFRFPIESIGGNDIGGGSTISPYYNLLYGWRIQFAPADQTITIVGNVITAEGDPPLVENAGAYHHQAIMQVSANSLTGAGGGSLTAAQVWQYVIEQGFTAEEMLRLLVAADTAKTMLSGGTFAIRDIADTKDRIVGTVDGQGNRLTVTVRDGS